MRAFEHPVDWISVDRLKPTQDCDAFYTPQQIERLATTLERYGWTNPILIDDSHAIIAGNGRFHAAALCLKLLAVPCVRLSRLSDQQKRAYLQVEKRTAEQAGWDEDLVSYETAAELGLSHNALKLPIAASGQAKPAPIDGREDIVPHLQNPAVTQPGDMWLLARHRLLCGDPLCESDLNTLLQHDSVDVVFAEPPYNVPISRFVTAPDAPISGPMTNIEFRVFLARIIMHARLNARDGAIGFFCVDWRRLGDLQPLLDYEPLTLELKSICVWNKSNPSAGPLYGRQHDLVAVIKLTPGPFINNAGCSGANAKRSDIWTYDAVEGHQPGRGQDYERRRACMPVRLIREAIEDVSSPDEVLLDLFGGAGASLIAAEGCGRRARVMEADPYYCDLILRRYATFSGRQPTLMISHETFGQVEARRRCEREEQN